MIDNILIIYHLNYKDMSKINDWLYLGSKKDAANVEWLAMNGITNVLNVAAELNDMTYPSHIDVMKIPLLDTPDEKIGELLDTGYSYLCLVRDSPKKKKVLVHCMAGISRSPTFVLYYLMKEQKIVLSAAYIYLKHCREQISPNSGFLTVLYKKQHELEITDTNLFVEEKRGCSIQ